MSEYETDETGEPSHEWVTAQFGLLSLGDPSAFQTPIPVVPTVPTSTFDIGLSMENQYREDLASFAYHRANTGLTRKEALKAHLSRSYSITHGQGPDPTSNALDVLALRHKFATKHHTQADGYCGKGKQERWELASAGDQATEYLLGLALESLNYQSGRSADRKVPYSLRETFDSMISTGATSKLSGVTTKTLEDFPRDEFWSVERHPKEPSQWRFRWNGYKGTESYLESKPFVFSPVLARKSGPPPSIASSSKSGKSGKSSRHKHP